MHVLPRRAAMALAMGADAFVQYGDNEKGEVAEALGSWAPRQQAYFDRPAIVAQRAIDARAQLRAVARQIAERRPAAEPER